VDCVRIKIMCIEVFDYDNMYDVRRYMKLLAETCNSVTESFGHVLSTKDIPILLLIIDEPRQE
jgi:hypothetical protein